MNEYKVGEKVKHLCYQQGEVVEVNNDSIKIKVEDASLSEGHKFFEHILSNENVPLPEKMT